MSPPTETSPPPESIEALLRHVSFFRDLNRVDLARLIGALEKACFPIEHVIFSEGAEADSLFLLERGRVDIVIRTSDGDQSVATVEAPDHFGDLGILVGRRTASAKTITEVDARVLPRHRFEQLVRERPSIGLAVAASLARLVEQRSRERVGAASRPTAPDIPAMRAQSGRSARSRIVGAALALAIPVALWATPPPSDLGRQGWHMLLIVLGAALAWLFQPVPDFVVALAMAAAWGTMHLVPVSLAFSGFANSTWVLALGAVGLATAMARSGLLFRLALLLMRIVPPTLRGQMVALLTGGVVMTPIVPMAAARIAPTGAMAQELAQELRLSGPSRATAALAFAGLIGYTSFSSVFLTGLATNFFVLGLLPPSDRGHIDWLTWLAWAAPTGLLLYLGAVAILFLVFRPEHTERIAADVIRRQVHALGPISKQEIVTIVGLGALIVGLTVQSAIGIDIAWLGLIALVVLLAGGVLDPSTFRGGIEWGFLVLFGILVGSGQVFHSVGLDQWIARRLVPLVHGIGHAGVLVVMLGACVAGCRLVLPRVPANFLLSLALVPAARQLGLTPWLVGFIVLMVGNTWLLPNLSDFYCLMRDATRGEMFTDRDGIVVGACLTLLVLLTIAASFPYWRAIGIISP